ncbi:glutamyl/glutaminyl-tRNA synthetase [Nocardiopsis sp. Huas11]|nr:glutamyl/glutaminyl-tRNA synthetase [Nocardiopsis sp. Huas11]
MTAPRPWFTHPTASKAFREGVRTRLGISPNHASFRVGVLRTHLLTALLAHSAARDLGVQAHVTVRWDDSDTLRSRDEHRDRLLHELRHVAQIPIEDPEEAFRQSQRGGRYRQALRRLDALRLLVTRRGVPCLDVAAVDRLMTAHGISPEALTASAAVNATTALSPEQSVVPLMRSDGRVLWHLATVVDDIEQRTTLIVRGTDKREATPIQVRLYWALAGGKHPPVHLFLPKLLEKDSVAPRVADLLEQGTRPSALRYFLAEPYLLSSQSTARSLHFFALVDQTRTVLPRHGDSLLDEWRLWSLDRKVSAVLTLDVAREELKERCPYSPSHIIAWVIRHYPRPLLQQVRLCRAFTAEKIDYDSPPKQTEEAWLWLEAWSHGTTKGPPPHSVRWVLTGQQDGPEAMELLEVFPPSLVASRLASASQELSRSKAARNRSNVRSRPSSSSDSKSGSPTVRPVTATRTGA